MLDVTLGPQDEIWVTSLSDTGVFIWEAISGEWLGPQIPFTEDIDGDSQIEFPHIAALSPDGRTLATAIYDEITIWDVQSGQVLGRSDVFLGFPPSALEFSFDGNFLASAGNEWQIYFWDVVSGASTGIWQTEHSRNITSLAFSADGRYVASGSEDGTVNLFELATGEQRLPHRSRSRLTDETISEFTTARLSVYLRCLEVLQEQGIRTVSSSALAERFGLNAAQIRKDLANFGEFGVRGVGYYVAELRRHLRQILGLDRRLHVAIVGAREPRAGAADYPGFRDDGFRVIGLFDTARGKVGRRSRGGVEIRHYERPPVGRLAHRHRHCRGRGAGGRRPAGPQRSSGIVACSGSSS